MWGLKPPPLLDHSDHSAAKAFSPQPWTDKPLRPQIPDFRSQLSDSSSQISDLRSRIAELRSQLSDLRSLIRSQNSDFGTLISDLRIQNSERVLNSESGDPNGWISYLIFFFKMYINVTICYSWLLLLLFIIYSRWQVCPSKEVRYGFTAVIHQSCKKRKN